MAFLGPAQQSIIVKDEHYGDKVAVARDLAIAMNQELQVPGQAWAWRRSS